MRATSPHISPSLVPSRDIIGFCSPSLAPYTSVIRATCCVFSFIRCVRVGSKDSSQPFHVCPPVRITATISGHIFSTLAILASVANGKTLHGGLMYVLRTKRECGLSEVHVETEETVEHRGSRLMDCQRRVWTFKIHRL